MSTGYIIKFEGDENEAVAQLSRGALLEDRTISKSALLFMAHGIGRSGVAIYDEGYSEGVFKTKGHAEYALKNLERFHDRSIGFLAGRGMPAKVQIFKIVKVGESK